MNKSVLSMDPCQMVVTQDRIYSCMEVKYRTGVASMCRAVRCGGSVASYL